MRTMQLEEDAQQEYNNLEIPTENGNDYSANGEGSEELHHKSHQDNSEKRSKIAKKKQSSAFANKRKSETMSKLESFTGRERATSEGESNQRRSSNSNNKGTNKGAGGGSYYGGHPDQELKDIYARRERKQKAKEAQSKRSKMSAMSGSHRQKIESLLDEKVRLSAAYAEQAHDDLEREKNRRYERYRIARRYSEPVERIISIYDDYSTDLYMVLGVGRTADGTDLKRRYRSLALVLHPGNYYEFIMLGLNL